MKRILFSLLLLISLSVEADVLRTIPSRLYASGTYQQTSDKIPVTSTGVKISLTRESWPEGSVARVEIWFSKDNGATLQLLAGVDLTGGAAFDKQGNPLLANSVATTWPVEGAQEIRGSDVRGQLIVFQPIRTAITVETLN